MSNAEKNWTGNIHLGAKVDIDVVLRQLVNAFNGSPFFQHNGMSMRVVDGQIEAYIEMQPYMIGNVAFQILHGGVAATILDSVGGIVAMGELYKSSEPDNLPDTIKKSHPFGYGRYAGGLLSTGTRQVFYCPCGNFAFRA